MRSHQRWSGQEWATLPKIVLLLGMGLPLPALAACQFTSVSDVNFGAYNVFARSPNHDGVGSLRIKCQGGGKASTVMLSSGQSQSFTARTLRSGAQSLNYNLYTSASRTIVWGDGTAGTHVMATGKSASTLLNVFGSIPEGQDPAIGDYADNIVVTVNF
jgi:spore coat protein U-like protein